ncbi:MAG TPA: 50S ribosomal protein L13 [Chloroflexia bacterium]|nr:50S ribosomal protein L13 [Chloroflexia bacterium]
MSIKTYTPTAAEAEAQREWYIIDAEGQTLGRLATLVASVLRGKNKPTFTPHMDMGDFVIVTNADKVVVTGKKFSDKMYYSHSGYMGSLKAIPFDVMMQKHPTLAVEAAVRGMLPRNRLGAQMITKLKVYAGVKHPHAAQKPKPVRINSETDKLEPVVK